MRSLPLLAIALTIPSQLTGQTQSGQGGFHSNWTKEQLKGFWEPVLVWTNGKKYSEAESGIKWAIHQRRHTLVIWPNADFDISGGIVDELELLEGTLHFDDEKKGRLTLSDNIYSFRPPILEGSFESNGRELRMLVATRRNLKNRTIPPKLSDTQDAIYVVMRRLDIRQFVGKTLAGHVREFSKGFSETNVASLVLHIDKHDSGRISGKLFHGQEPRKSKSRVSDPEHLLDHYTARPFNGELTLRGIRLTAPPVKHRPATTYYGVYSSGRLTGYFTQGGTPTSREKGGTFSLTVHQAPNPPGESKK